METGLTMEYDRVGDILYVNKVQPYPEQQSTELAYGVIARSNPTTGEIENLEILFFKQRVERGEELNIPILANLRPLAKAG